MKENMPSIDTLMMEADAIEEEQKKSFIAEKTPGDLGDEINASIAGALAPKKSEPYVSPHAPQEMTIAEVRRSLRQQNGGLEIPKVAKETVKVVAEKSKTVVAKTAGVGGWFKAKLGGLFSSKKNVPETVAVVAQGKPMSKAPEAVAQLPKSESFIKESGFNKLDRYFASHNKRASEKMGEHIPKMSGKFQLENAESAVKTIGELEKLGLDGAEQDKIDNYKFLAENDIEDALSQSVLDVVDPTKPFSPETIEAGLLALWNHSDIGWYDMSQIQAYVLKSLDGVLDIRTSPKTAQVQSESESQINDFIKRFVQEKKVV